MPQLKHLSCSIQWSKSGAPFQEYGTLYGDGVVESFIVVPDTPQPFTIHIKSRGYIYEGLAAIVFIDGNYQTNRNRTNLIPLAKDQSLSRTEIDFLIRQKEKPHGEGVYMGREWRFDDHNIVLELPTGIKENHFDNLGTIEVLVLRCRATLPKKAAASPVSSAADSDVFCERSIHDAIDMTTKFDEAVQDTEETALFGLSMFDGPDDRPYHFNPSGPPAGTGWQGHPHYCPPGHPVPLGNHEQYSSGQGLPHHQYPPAMHSMPHMQTPYPIPAAPRPGRHVHFDIGSQRPPQTLFGAPIYPVNSRPPSYERHRYPVPSLDMVNPATGPASHSESNRPPCGYPSTQCQCGLHHNQNPLSNNNNQHVLQAWQNQPNSYLHAPIPEGHLNIHQPTFGSLMPNHPILAQQYYPHILPSHAQWPGPIQIPYRFTSASTWPDPTPYSVPPTNNGTIPETGNGNPQHNEGNTAAQQQTNGSQDQNTQTVPNNTWTSSNNELANNQSTNGNTGTQPNQSQQQNAKADTTNGPIWGDNNNGNNGQQDWPANPDNSNGTNFDSGTAGANNGNLDDNKNDNGNSWADNNDSSNNNNTWANNDTSNDNNNNNNNHDSWTNNDDINGGGNDNANTNNQTVDNNAWGGGNDGGGNDTGNWSNSNDQPQDDKKESSNDHGVEDPAIASHLSASGMRPLFGPHGQYYSWEPQDVDAPLPDAPEEPRYDVPKSIADSKRTTKQVQPGQGYLYYKKRSVPEYVDDMNEPYARFVFKYRTREQVKNELGIEIETEATGDESIQELENMDKQALIEMLIRAKGALGGKVPSPPQNPTILAGEGSTKKTPVPVDPPVHTFLKYQLPPIRLPANAGNAGKYSDINPQDNGATSTDWNANGNNTNQQGDNWNTDAGHGNGSGSGNGDWNNSGNQDNRGTGWDGLLEKEPTAPVIQQNWGTPVSNHNQQAQFQNQTQDPEPPGYIPIPPPPPPPPPPISNPAFDPSQLHTALADHDWNMQNMPSAISSPASTRPPYNPQGGGGASNQPPGAPLL